MVAVSLKFPSGRFHATPWGRHVNEGAPEWPPSPWRLLRSLIACWKTKCVDLSEASVRSTLETVVTPPRFSLPEATVAHSRHYMPLGLSKKGDRYVEDRTKIFDAFICLDRSSEIIAAWPDVSLEPEQAAVLAILLERLGYLGRAESWCEARLLDDAPAIDSFNSRPLAADEDPGPNEDLTRVLCPDPDTAFSDEHVRPATKGKKSRGVRPVYDPSWHLAIETGQLHAERWSDPPGSQWVTYVRPRDCFHPQGTRPLRPRLKGLSMQVARYALDSTVLPLSTEALPLAEQARSRLMGMYGKAARGGKSQVFSGKDAGGQPLAGHSHAYYLPADEDGDGRLDHFTVVADTGFDANEVKVLDWLRTLSREKGAPDIRLLLLALGRRDQFQGGPLAESRTWVSETPFLVTRHPKKNGVRRDPPELLTNRVLFVQQVLKEELNRFAQRRGFTWTADEMAIEPLLEESAFRVQPGLWASDATGPGLRPIQFKRFRTRKRDDDGGRRWSGAFLITFPEPVRGPVCLGHSSHFGLGLFLPVKETKR